MTGPVIRERRARRHFVWPACLMPTKAEEYRARADEYERVANQLSLESAKSVVLEMVREWRELAEQEQEERPKR